MSDKQFLTLLALAAGVYVFFFGIPERPTQATGGNPFSPATAVYSIDTSQPAQVTITDEYPQVTVVTATPGSAPVLVEPMATDTAVPPTSAPTSTPAPTRPAIESLPLGEGPYTVQQMQICRDVWAQSLQGELNTYQFGYCKGVVQR